MRSQSVMDLLNIHLSPKALRRTSGGNMKTTGFTLIELMVVMALISIMLFFAIPKLSSNVFAEGKKKTTRWLLLTVKQLKARAISEKKNYSLHCSMDENKFWVTSDGMTEKEQERGGEKGFEIPEGVQLIDVELISSEKVEKGATEILFYSKGYSDRAIIHLGQGEDDFVSVVIEPFLPGADWFQNYVSFEDVRYDAVL